MSSKLEEVIMLSFKVKDLEEMHMSLLRRTNIYYESHNTPTI